MLQNKRAASHLMRHAKPGARVAVGGMKFLPWWWGAPIKLITGYRTRHCLTTYRGLRAPCAPLLAYCPDLKVIEIFHLGTSYVAAGTVRAV